MSAAVLTKLDGYMAAAGYDADHPWRSQIATVLAIPAPTLPDAGAVLDAVDGAGIITDLLKLAVGQCGKNGDICQVRSAIRAVGRYVDDINTATAFIAGDGAA